MASDQTAVTTLTQVAITCSATPYVCTEVQLPPRCRRVTLCCLADVGRFSFDGQTDGQAIAAPYFPAQADALMEYTIGQSPVSVFLAHATASGVWSILMEF